MSYTIFRYMLLVFCLVISACASKQKLPTTSLGETDALNTTGIFSVSDQESKAQYDFIKAQGLFLIQEYQACKVQLEELIQKHPKKAAFHYKLSQCQAQLFDLKSAILSAKRTLDLETQNPVYYQYLSELYYLDHQWEQAAEVYQKMILTLKGQEQYNLRVADIYMDLGKSKYNERTYYIQNPNSPGATSIRKIEAQISQAHLKAIKALDDYEQFYGFDQEVIQKKRSLYLIENQPALAKAEGQKLIDSDPQNPQHWLSQSSIIEQSESNQAGIQYLQNILPELKETGLVRLRLAQLYLKIGDQKESDQQLKAAFESNEMPFDEKIKMLSGILGTNQKAMQEQGLELAVRMTELYPTRPESYSVLGDAYYVNDQPAKAREAYEQILVLDASKPQVYDQLLFLDSLLDDLPAALQHAQLAIERLDDPGRYYLTKAKALVQLKKYQEAKYVLTEAQETNQSQKEYQVLMAQVSAELGLYPQAYAAYDHLLEINPNDYSVMNQYAYLIAQTNGDLDLAMAHMEKLTRIFPENSDYLHTYAWVLYQADLRIDDAAQMIQKSVSIKPTHIAYEHGALILDKKGASELAQEFRTKAKELK